MLAHYSYQVAMFALMIFGFGFVVFFHELGHFLAARWVGIRVEQFAVGFGQAMCAWRKGIGWRRGSTHDEFLKRAEQYLDEQNKSQLQLKEKTEYSEEEIARAGEALGFGETEYRLNWIPLGGYVKMLGQDDLKPNATADDPRAYNKKSVGQRMIVVSAGVIMNIILAAIGFMIIFLMGFNAPAAIVGGVSPGSPAQHAGLQVGDRIISLDGTHQYDYNRLQLTTALLKDDRDVPMVVERTAPDGSKKQVTLQIRPARMDDDSKSFLMIGVEPPAELRGIPTEAAKYVSNDGRSLPDYDIVKPGDEIVAIAGKTVTNAKYDFPQLDEALQHSDGKPVPVTIQSADGQKIQRAIQPYLKMPFGTTTKLAIVGMEPRPVVDQIAADSTAKDKLQPGDVIQMIAIRDADRNPDLSEVRRLASDAAKEDHAMTIQLLRDGKSITVSDVASNTKLGNSRRGLGIGLGYDNTPVVSQVLADSPAKKAGIPDGARILSVDAQHVDNWFQVSRLLGTVGSHTVVAQAPASAATTATAPVSYAVEIGASDVEAMHNYVQATAGPLELQTLEEPRKTSNPLEAMSWGVVETRDFILEFYVTIARMFEGRISASNMMGPVGIVYSGAKFAAKGPAWVIWFLAMISANLAVVNFLPIPIVDGGLFTFLILEKINGRPASPKVQAVAQIVGFAIICGVFLLVTFQDIKRFFGY